MQHSRGRRRGSVFPIRLTDEQRAEIESRMQATPNGPRAIGPWLLWSALEGPGSVIPGRPGNTAARPGRVLPARADRIILDLCGGSGAWSRPYADAGYDVRLVTLPEHDVSDYQPPANVHGILAAPPCTEFSLAKAGHPRDFASALRVVCACLRIIAIARPQWWALENPTGMLGHFLGTPRDVFQPCDFGDPWTKRTALWGYFTLPARRYVRPSSGMPGRTSAERAVTPPGFARAFFEANP